MQPGSYGNREVLLSINRDIIDYVIGYNCDHRNLAGSQTEATMAMRLALTRGRELLAPGARYLRTSVANASAEGKYLTALPKVLWAQSHAVIAHTFNEAIGCGILHIMDGLLISIMI